VTNTDKRIEEISRQDYIDHIKNATQNMVAGPCDFAIDANTNDVETATAFYFCIGGIWYTKAIDAAIDISAECAQFATDALSSITLADDYEAVYIFTIAADGTLDYVRSTPLALDSGTYHEVPDFDRDTVVCFAAVKVLNETGSVFTFGTTGLDTSGITDTYYNLQNPFPGDKIFGTA